MAIHGLTLIGESINDSVPSTHALYENNDMEGIIALAKSQMAGGATYIDVNVGLQPPARMAEVIARVQASIPAPLAVDSPDFETAKAGLEALAANAPTPILNSISPLRMEMFDLLRIRPFRPILLISEGLKDGQAAACVTAEETINAAQLLLTRAREAGVAPSDCIFDPGIAPIATDMEGNLKRLMTALRLMHEDPFFAGVHVSVGLSNFTVMLPPRRANGELVKAPLESAFLTRAMPLGLDHVIGSVKRNYEKLPEGHPALVCFDECLAADNFDALVRVQEFYS